MKNGWEMLVWVLFGTPIIILSFLCDGGMSAILSGRFLPETNTILTGMLVLLTIMNVALGFLLIVFRREVRGEHF